MKLHVLTALFVALHCGNARAVPQFSITDLTASAAAPGAPYGINNRGDVAGAGGGRAWLYSGGTTKDLGTLVPSDDFEYSGAFAVSDNGTVVGWSYKSDVTSQSSQ